MLHYYKYQPLVHFPQSCITSRSRDYSAFVQTISRLSSLPLNADVIANQKLRPSIHFLSVPFLPAASLCHSLVNDACQSSLMLQTMKNTIIQNSNHLTADLLAELPFVDRLDNRLSSCFCS